MVDWYGVKKLGYYTATRKVYAQVDVSLTYSSLFLVASAPLPPITPWVVSESSVQGTLTLSISTTAGKSLHQQKWNVDLSVAINDMGFALELPSPVSWMPTAELAGEVLLFRLALLSTSGDNADVSSNTISSQLYTFAVLQQGVSIHGKMDTVQPMRPLLHAPAAQCALSKPICSDNTRLARAGSCSAVLRNSGVVPCLYVELELQDATPHPDQPQFYAAVFSDNFVTLSEGESTTIEFRRGRKFHGDSDPNRSLSSLLLCATGWNMASVCVSIAG